MESDVIDTCRLCIFSRGRYDSVLSLQLVIRKFLNIGVCTPQFESTFRD